METANASHQPVQVSWNLRIGGIREMCFAVDPVAMYRRMKSAVGLGRGPRETNERPAFGGLDIRESLLFEPASDLL